jgi:hypothetical protein
VESGRLFYGLSNKFAPKRVIVDSSSSRRPIEQLDPYRMSYGATAAGATLAISTSSPGCWAVHHTPLPTAARPAHTSAPPSLLIEGDTNTDLLITHPLNTLETSDKYLQPKYTTVRTVTFEGFIGVRAVLGGSKPQDEEQLLWVLGCLPAGFVRNPYYGLGVKKTYEYLIGAIERIAGVTDLHIRRGGRTGLPAVSGNSYIITAKIFDDVRKAINRIHAKALAIAADEKRAYVHNMLLTALDPVVYPEQRRAYRKDAIVEAIGKSLSQSVALSVADQEAVVRMTRVAARPLSRTKPAELLELNSEIEVVTLERLIEHLSDTLEKKLKEPEWQAFFTDNPFVLRLAFGLPIIAVGGQLSVGGRKFSGAGDKISDFVVKAAASGNLALIEIKTPETALLGATQYRDDLYAPAHELSGAVNQVLDQRYHLQQNIHSLKGNSGIFDVETYAVQCLVIAGRRPEAKVKLKSLELFRNSLKSVTIVTYDELLDKLRHLLEFLREPSVSPATEAPPAPSPSVSSPDGLVEEVHR